MKSIIPYLNFDGACREAMTFYAKCMGATLDVKSFGDMPGNPPPGAKDRVMHARLEKGSVVLMASDTMPGMPFQTGNNLYLCISPDSKAETDQLFAALGEGGKVVSPLQDQFWGGYFGVLTDRFGVQWMFNFEQPQK